MVVLRQVLGEELRRLRMDQHRTLLDVSSEARVSLGYLSEVERGRKEVGSECLAAICAALGEHLSDVLASVAREIAQRERPTVVPMPTRKPAAA
jgi:transcriptional regulator with XRE-family HTH domain